MSRRKYNKPTRTRNKPHRVMRFLLREAKRKLPRSFMGNLVGKPNLIALIIRNNRRRFGKFYNCRF